VAPVSWLSLDDLVDYWKGQKERRPRTVEGVVHAFDTLKALHAGLQLHAGNITPEHLVAHKDARLQAKKSPATVRKELNLMGAVFSCAVSNRKAPSNPVKGITVAQEARAGKARIPLAVPDLQAVFSTPVYSRGARPVAGCGNAAFWLPLMALFTGARMEELAQLHTSDVGAEGTVSFLLITDVPDSDEAAGRAKRLKNAASRRRIPIHAELIRIGFLEFVDAAREAKSVRLFVQARVQGRCQSLRHCQGTPSRDDRSQLGRRRGPVWRGLLSPGSFGTVYDKADLHRAGSLWNQVGPHRGEAQGRDAG
jgi:hypothetical protein